MGPQMSFQVTGFSKLLHAFEERTRQRAMLALGTLGALDT
jgi:hypothetical protein